MSATSFRSMEPTPLFRLADRALDGQLREFIRGSRDAGRSWDWIARELYVRTDREVDVTGSTVRLWGQRLSDQDEAA